MENEGFKVRVTLEYHLSETVHACLLEASLWCQQLLLHPSHALSRQLSELDLLDHETIDRFIEQLNHVPPPCRLYITVPGMLVQYTILTIYQHSQRLPAAEQDLLRPNVEVPQPEGFDMEEKTAGMLEETEARLSENIQYIELKQRLNQLVSI